MTDIKIRNFISRELVLALLEDGYRQRRQTCSWELLKAVEMLPSFPAPNPYEEGGRNIMGQTEDEFWDAVERVEMK